MMKWNKLEISRALGMSILGAAGLVGLCSCGDDGDAVAEKPAEPASAPAPSGQHKEALFQSLIYELGKSAGSVASLPQLTEQVRHMHELLENYYQEMAPGHEGKIERVRLSLRIAEVLRDLTAWEKAFDSFSRAQSDWDSLSEEAKKGVEAQDMLSSIQRGQGMCRLRSGRSNEALPYYEKALATDMSRFQALAPEDGKMPQGETDGDLARAAEALLTSYRCLGECQIVADDPEEARVTFKKGIEQAHNFVNLSPRMMLQYIRIVGDIGNLESDCGNEMEALKYWNEAFQHCRKLIQQAGDREVMASARALQASLEETIKTVSRKLNREAGNAEAQGGENTL